MNREYIIDEILKHKVVAIVRGAAPEQCTEVARALYSGGIRLMEITYNQNAPESWEGTAQAIREISKEFNGRMCVGAGTVTSTRLVELTAEAGGTFIISPNTNVSVIKRTIELGLVSIPGAMTPTEVLLADESGADFVKLFPAANLGIEYLKAIRGPINHVRIMATGGISEANAKDYLAAGAVGLGVGGSLANKKNIEAGEYDKLTEAAEKLLEAIQ